MKIYLSFILLLITSSCSKIPVPSILAPSENRDIRSVSFGEEPIRYQNIMKNYLITNLKNYETAKVEFVNKPSRISIDHLGGQYSGYRVCLSINEKRGENYIGYKNHFFLMNNNKVDLHLFDSGLLKIPFEYCVSRNMNNEYFIDDIPENIDAISIETMGSIELTADDNSSYIQLKNELDKLKKENNELKKLDKDKPESNQKGIEDIAKIETPIEAYETGDNIYISCIFDDKSNTYIFNTSEETFKLINKVDIVSYALSFNDAYIVASSEAVELTINRVTGKAALQNKTLKQGMCELTNKTKF